MIIAIAYHSGFGHTATLAQAIAQGIQEGDATAQVDVLDVTALDEDAWEILHKAEAIVFGSPTYMGSVSGPFKTFMDQTGNFWLDQKWRNKIAAGFTISTGPSGDKLNTLIQLSIFAAQHGMVWVGQNSLGSLYTKDGQALNEPASWLGLMAIASRDKDEKVTSQDAATARIFGSRVAEATRRWKA